jgi:hypothetical protein
MASLEMKGPYTLDNATIDKFVEVDSIGNYALGYEDDDGKFIVEYVGRSDEDLNGRLKQWVGKHKQFKFSNATSGKAAFEKECKNYHDFGGSKKLGNDIHPDRPEGEKWKCPYCNVFDE